MKHFTILVSKKEVITNFTLNNIMSTITIHTDFRSCRTFTNFMLKLYQPVFSSFSIITFVDIKDDVKIKDFNDVHHRSYSYLSDYIEYNVQGQQEQKFPLM